MTKKCFESLEQALMGWFDQPLSNLPKKQLNRYEKDFFPHMWDELTPERRQNLAKQYDVNNDSKCSHQSELSFSRGFKHAKERVNMLNASELNRRKREKGREQRKTKLKMSKIAKKSRRKKVSDDDLLAILDRKPENITGRDIIGWVCIELEKNSMSLSRQQIGVRLRSLNN